MVQTARRFRVGGLMIPLVALLAVAAAALAAWVLSRAVGGDDLPPPAPAFAGIPEASTEALTVKQRQGDTIVLSRQVGENAVEVRVPLTPATKIERLTPITAADLQDGEYLTLVGIPNEVRNFSIRSIVVMAAPATSPVGGIAQSPAGFFGHEANQDRRDRPILGGQITARDGVNVTIKNPAGDVSVAVGPEAPARLYRLEQITAEAINEGDRIGGAFRSGNPTALLVLPAR